MQHLHPQQLETYKHWLADRGLSQPLFRSPGTQAPACSSQNLNKKTPVFAFIVLAELDYHDAACRGLLEKMIKAMAINTDQIHIVDQPALESKLELFSPTVCLDFSDTYASTTPPSKDWIVMPRLSQVLKQPTMKVEIWRTLRSLMSRAVFPSA